MADGRHIRKRRFWSYLGSGSSDFHKIMFDDAKSDSNDGRVPQISNFEN